MAKTPKRQRKLHAIHATYTRRGFRADLMKMGNHHRRWEIVVQRPEPQAALLIKPGRRPYADPYSRPVKTGIDWPHYRHELSLEPWKYSNADDEMTRTVFLGSIPQLYPSGKYWVAGLSSSHVNYHEQMKDSAYNSALEFEADNQGFYLSTSDGDGTALMLTETKDPEDVVIGDVVEVKGKTYTIVEVGEIEDESDLTEDGFIMLVNSVNA